LLHNNKLCFLHWIHLISQNAQSNFLRTKYVSVSSLKCSHFTSLWLTLLRTRSPIVKHKCKLISLVITSYNQRRHFQILSLLRLWIVNSWTQLLCKSNHVIQSTFQVTVQIIFFNILYGNKYWSIRSSTKGRN
jgi:hypothetical protein